MYLVEYTAAEPFIGEITLDLDRADTKEEATALAVKAIEQAFPDYEYVKVIGIREI